MKYRFYSPVQGIIDYDFNKDMDYDSYFDEDAMEELGEVDFDFLTAEDLTAYQEEINQAIRKEWDYETDEDMGLMHYFCLLYTSFISGMTNMEAIFLLTFKEEQMTRQTLTY